MKKWVLTTFSFGIFLLCTSKKGRNGAYGPLCTIVGWNVVNSPPIVAAPLISTKIKVVGAHAGLDNAEAKIHSPGFMRDIDMRIVSPYR